MTTEPAPAPARAQLHQRAGVQWAVIATLAVSMISGVFQFGVLSARVDINERELAERAPDIRNVISLLAQMDALKSEVINLRSALADLRLDLRRFSQRGSEAEE